MQPTSRVRRDFPSFLSLITEIHNICYHTWDLLCPEIHVKEKHHICLNIFTINVHYKVENMILCESKKRQGRK
jgi:hypothetical protein